VSIPAAILLVVIGVGLVVTFAGRLVRGVVGTSLGFGVSAFLISVIFVGFDPENLFVGATGSYEGVPGIAFGSIIGAAMVALALAFGVTALLVPMTFEQVPRQVLAVPVMAVVLFGLLALDGVISRGEGAALLLGYATSVAFLVWLSRHGVDIEAATKPRRSQGYSRGRAAGLMVVALVAILVGSELLVEGSKTIIEEVGISDTFYGMAILALLVSIEELARELPAARRGHPEITFGNVVGSHPRLLPIQRWDHRPDPAARDPGTGPRLLLADHGDHDGVHRSPHVAESCPAMGRRPSGLPLRRLHRRRAT
jgi:cation:H+ antiporter